MVVTMMTFRGWTGPCLTLIYYLTVHRYASLHRTSLLGCAASPRIIQHELPLFTLPE